ncbi:M15 family metallopeptidase [Actinomadura decatromicini]|uniref:M15 family metallopeptidase n=1 Tax=Actinomadura decatromicini TaxID=2604572 RepID=A0A5D3FRA4_9ACTN|nr:M15 family metallopeptidase [Actinomadura decatromicini]TYK50753.1 M15 family metallopeptidase [Actinomadura decatromicini]
MKSDDSPTRRAVLQGAAGAAAVAGIAGSGIGALAAPASAAPGPGPKKEAALKKSIEKARARVETGRRSANGWSMEKRVDAGGSIWTKKVPGSDVSVALRIGDAAIVLTHVIRRFHYEIDTLENGDVVGFKPPRLLFEHGWESNHSSGTAIDIRPGWYPDGAKGGFFPHELVTIRDILADCEGAVKWGGDFATPAESHFQIDVRPDDALLRKVADKLRGWNAAPGEGAGVLVDVLAPSRRSRADALERRQRRR